MQGSSPSAPGSPREDRWRRLLATVVVLGVLAALGSTLWYVEGAPPRREGLEREAPERAEARRAGPAGAAAEGTASEETPAPSPPSPLAPDVAERLERTLQDLEAHLDTRLRALEESLRSQERTSSGLRDRGERESAMLERIRGRLSALELRPAPVPPSTSAPADLGPLMDRVYKLEVSVRREGAARLEAQEEMARRIFNVEVARDQSDAARLEAQQALQARIYNAEQRVQAMEERLLAFEKQTLQRLRQLEGAR